MKNSLTREDFLEMEQHCDELACGEHSPEDRKRFEKMALRYREQANAIKDGRKSSTLLTEIASRMLLVFGAIFYVIGCAVIHAAEACWRKADRNRGKQPSHYMHIHARIGRTDH